MLPKFYANFNTLLTEGLSTYIQERDQKRKAGTAAFLTSVRDCSQKRLDNSRTMQRSYFAEKSIERPTSSNEQRRMSNKDVYVDNKYHSIDNIIKKPDPSGI